MASVVLCPAEEVRIKMVADPSYANGTMSCLQKISVENGVFATFSGFPAMCAKQVPYTMAKFAVQGKAQDMMWAALGGALGSLAWRAPRWGAQLQHQWGEWAPQWGESQQHPQRGES